MLSLTSTLVFATGFIGKKDASATANYNGSPNTDVLIGGMLVVGTDGKRCVTVGGAIKNCSSLNGEDKEFYLNKATRAFGYYGGSAKSLTCRNSNENLACGRTLYTTGDQKTHRVYVMAVNIATTSCLTDKGGEVTVIDCRDGNVNQDFSFINLKSNKK